MFENFIHEYYVYIIPFFPSPFQFLQCSLPTQAHSMASSLIFTVTYVYNPLNPFDIATYI